MIGRDGAKCVGCGHRGISHGYDPELGIGRGACGIDRDQRNAASGWVGDPCPCQALVPPAKLHASEMLPGDVVLDGWTIYSIAQRLHPNPRMRVMVITWAEGLDEDWAPSMLPPGEAHHVERDGAGVCPMGFWESEERCALAADGHEVHANGRYMWGPALAKPVAVDELEPVLVDVPLFDLEETEA